VREGSTLLDADFAVMVNESDVANAFAFSFDKIDIMSPGLFIFLGFRVDC
jgi:hypothetical protein